MVKNKIHLIATQTFPYEGSLIFINDIFEACCAKFIKIRSLAETKQKKTERDRKSDDE